MKHHLIWLLIGAWSCGGCAPWEMVPKGPGALTPQGLSVEVVSEAPEGCESMGTVESNHQDDALTYELNVKNATNKARNDVSARGATHLVISKEEKISSPKHGDKCGLDNCARIEAQAYRCPQ